MWCYTTNVSYYIFQETCNFGGATLKSWTKRVWRSFPTSAFSFCWSPFSLGSVLLQYVHTIVLFGSPISGEFFPPSPNFCDADAHEAGFVNTAGFADGRVEKL